MSEFCGNPTAEAGEALMPSELLVPSISDLIDMPVPKESANLTDQESASNVKRILGT
jgi:hypothetical protein